MKNLFVRATTLLAGSASISLTAPSFPLPEEVQQTWAGFSPWFPAAEYTPPPAGCNVVQANLLQRHGARFPSPSAGKYIEGSVKKLQKATSFTPNLGFVKNYEYTLGTSDLVQFGAQQSFDSGQEDFVLYAALLNKTSLPFVRSTGSGRVIDSARNWTAGVARASNKECVPKLNLIISESTVNDTLNAHGCPKSGTSTSEVTAWTNVFAPAITKRINSEAPGANLNDQDIVNLMTLCAFGTVAHEKVSPWCYPFTLDEWESYLYSKDLGYYYWTGPGQKFGPVQGVGYVNELLARLTGQPVQDKTQTNYTLDKNPATFPLDRTFYADFTHDTLMTAVFAAIGLFKQSEDLPTDQIDKGRTYISSQLVPFSGRMITEKITCDGSGYETKGTYVRVLVNDAVQPLEFCKASVDGLCTLTDFVASQSFARTNGNGLWAQCFAT